MKKLINDVAAVVPQMLQGLALAGPGLALLDGWNVLLRDDLAALRARGEVALVSGGGAGHEPAHAGYVGAGMLSAAVSGDVFTSPSVDAVLAAIQAVAGPGGVLLIVKNYTGDRLNFGLAAELARAQGIDVAMVVVADDVALAANGDHAGRRGLAGTLLVHKLAGAAAAAGRPLAEVVAVARGCAQAMGTMGVALGACTVPAAGRPGFTLGSDEVELGLGIHGEAGVQRVPLASADALVAQLLDRICTDLALRAGEPVALLVNSLGGTPAMELAIVQRAAVLQAQARGLVVQRLISGALLTALEMPGVSITLLRLDNERLVLLDAPTRAPAWPLVAGRPLPMAAPRQALAGAALPAESLTPAQAPAVDPPASSPGAASRTAQQAGSGADQGTVSGTATGQVLGAVLAALLAAQDELTRLDQAVGDGDLGISLARGASAITDSLPTLPLHPPAALLRHLAGTVRLAVGGTSGPLYAIGLMRAAQALDHPTEAATGPQTAASTARLAAALAAAAQGIAQVGGATAGECTMLDALLPAAAALQQAAAAGLPPAAAWPAAVAAAEAGTAATATLVPRRGRSSYLGARAIGHVDPGAQAVVVWLKALAAAWPGPV